jgi:hypothetical protein
MAKQIFLCWTDAERPNSANSQVQLQTIMATIREGKISTTFNYNKIKVVPELDLPALVRSHSGGAPSVSSISTSIRSESRKIGREESCFITKGHAYSLEKAHFVNAVRRDENLKADVVSRFTFERPH